MAYGYCPFCESPVVSRERRINGNDQCESGHVYPSVKTLREKPSEQKYNINDRIVVTLKQGGVEAIEEYHSGVEKKYRPVVSVGQEYTTTLWAAFAIFGSRMQIGFNHPIETSFRFEKQT